MTVPAEGSKIWWGKIEIHTTSFKRRGFLLLLPKSGGQVPLGPPGSSGSENWGLTSQVMTDPGYKIGSMSGLFPHFQFVCLVIHSQLKPSKCPYLAPSHKSPPRKLAISMLHVVSFILYFYPAYKGQLISKCPFGVIVWTKIPTKFFSRISALASKKRSNKKVV